MDENRFEGYDNSYGGIGDSEKTQEMDSVSAEYPSVSEQHGITPREQFTELNSADSMEKTRRMDSITADEDEAESPEEDYSPSGGPVKKRRKKKKKRINHTRTMGQIFLGVLISVAAVCIGVILADRVIVAMKDFTGMAKTPREVEIEIDDSMNVEDIAGILHDNKIIEMPSLFKAYIRFADEENGFLNGDFIVNANMSYSSLIEALKTKKTYTETVMVMIPEGATARQIGQLLEENYVCRASDFLMYYKSKLDKYDFEEQIEQDPDRFYALEGYLFPDTYEFYVIDDLRENKDFDTLQYAKEAADKMYKNFESKITKQMKARMDELGLTLDETIILASLIQKEGTDEENMSMISSVFHNRLDDPENFPQLQTDTTDTYIDDCIMPSVPTGSQDLYADIIAAYDTYSCEGLPAGAVCSPGLEAINAALYPAETDYYYFLCSDDGVFYYAVTAEEHEQNIIDAALREEE